MVMKIDLRVMKEVLMSEEWDGGKMDVERREWIKNNISEEEVSIKEFLSEFYIHRSSKALCKTESIYYKLHYLQKTHTKIANKKKAHLYQLQKMQFLI
jgi:hypothetical protein